MRNGFPIENAGASCAARRACAAFAIFSLVLFLPTAALSAEIDWTEHVITNNHHHDPNSVEEADIDGDGDTDLVVGATFFGFGALSWMENDGSQTFTEHMISSVGNYWRAVPFDIDDDDDVDILAFRGSEGPPYRLTLFLNDGSENFTEQDIFNPTGDYPATRVVDLDDDGDGDVLTTKPTAALVWLENTGGASFAERIIETTLSRVYSADVIDFDDDDDLDIFGVSIPDNSVYWWENDGDETFTRHFVFAFPGLPWTLGGLAAGDMDDDGDMDVVAASEIYPSFGRVSWLENQGVFGFVEHVVLDVNSSSRIHAVDLDHDDDLDIVSGQYSSGGGESGISWYENDGTATFTRRVIRSPFNGARPNVGDIDGDGALDVFGCAFFLRDIVWWESDVVLNAPPELTCNDPYVEQDPGTCSAAVDCETIAFCFDPDGDILSQSCAPAGPYPVGSTDVVVTCDDGALTATATCTVTVEDTEPPDVTVVLDPTTLWPPNHRMLNVTASVAAADNCGTPSVLLAAVASNEADNGAGDGNTVNDIQGAAVGTADFEFQLRAERAGGGGGRIYTATYEAEDAAGNTATAAGFAVVPHDQGGATDPIELILIETPAGTVLSWTAVPGEASYDVIRGVLSEVADAEVVIDLGSVFCLGENLADPGTAGNADAAIPEGGDAFFYLVQYDDGTTSSFGTESTDLPRAPSGGNCD